MTQPLAGTLAESYLRQRGILQAAQYPALRFHPSCYYRDLATGRTSSYPALIAAVTDRFGMITPISSDPDSIRAALGRHGWIRPGALLVACSAMPCVSAFLSLALYPSRPSAKDLKASCRSSLLCQQCRWSQH
jgi:hypothetical protein